MAEIDLDAIRAARIEAGGPERHSIKFHKKTFQLAQELPWDIVEGFAVDDYDQVANGIKQLLDGKWDEFRKLGPSSQDLVALAIEAAKKYGVTDLGESRASDGSSSDTSTSSRPTSTATTPSTSRKRSGAKNNGSRSGVSGRS